jgi:hypothetical protein
MASVQDLYERVIIPHTKTLPATQQTQAKQDLLTKVELSNLTLGSQTTSDDQMQQDRYTELVMMDTKTA